MTVLGGRIESGAIPGVKSLNKHVLAWQSKVRRSVDPLVAAAASR